MNLFEELIKSPEFNSDIPNKIQYFGSDCI